MARSLSGSDRSRKLNFAAVFTDTVEGFLFLVFQ